MSRSLELSQSPALCLKHCTSTTTTTTHQRHISTSTPSIHPIPPSVQLLVKEEPAEQGQQQLSAAPSGDSNLGPDIKALISRTQGLRQGLR
mmetsp:Transcript_7777/g.18740  ORF Transcript_7777/g.18740 Transcript_7777/m.18740 type:complete len:91 (+) Transcript_7777:143-415(+)